jgi:hypothetical protein
MVPMQNTPRVKMGLVGVSRDCFPIGLTRRRMYALVVAGCVRESGCLLRASAVQNPAARGSIEVSAG